MTQSRRIGIWFAATSAIFFTRALLFSSFISHGPEVQAALHLDTAGMGVLSMLYPTGGLVGILFSSALVSRFGSKTVNTATFLLAGAAFVGLGQSITAGDVPLSATLLFLVGFPMAISDFVGNIEGTKVNNQSKHSIFPAIHGAFGLGMLVGANLAGWLIGAGVELAVTFTVVGIFVGGASLFAGLVFTPRERVTLTLNQKMENRRASIKVWFEKRSILIAIICFSFVMAETSAGTWVPIALTKTGFTGAEAAFAFGIFWIVVTAGRLAGGVVVDKIGRHVTVLISALLTSVGILVFMSGEAIHLPYLGLVCWGLGMAVGAPLAIASMGDDAAMASPRINMIITMVYLSSITVGPALGTIGQNFGIYVAFGIPLAMLLLSATISNVTKLAVTNSAKIND